MRWIKSMRGSRPKISSESSMSPADVPSSDVMSIFTGSALLLFLLRGHFRRSLAGRTVFLAAHAELARLRRVLWQCALHRIAHIDPPAAMSRHRAFDQDQPARDIRLHDAQILRRHALDTHMSGHFLVLERLARILTAAGRAVRAMRDRHAVRGAKPTEIPALHRAGKTLADRRAGDIDELPGNEVIGGDLGADGNQPVDIDAEFRDLQSRLDFRHGEAAALGLRDVLHLGAPDAELHGGVADLLLCAMRDYLTAVELQHRDRHVFAGVREDAGHADFLCDDA